MAVIRMLARAESRQRLKSWLVLALLVALVSGLVLAAVAAGRRTSSAFPRFVAAHGFDIATYNDTPDRRIADLPEVASSIMLRSVANGTPHAPAAARSRAAISPFRKSDATPSPGWSS